MASCNPVAPVMDWTEDVELHKRYMEWKEEVELEMGSTLSGKSNSVKSNYVLRWAGKPARDYLKSLPDSEFKYEGVSADEILTALEMRMRPKSNEIAAFTKLHSLKQGDTPLSEFIREARRLAELCNYPNDKDRLIRDMIVSGIRSLRAYQKCLDTKDLSLQDCITICQAEDAIHMQVQDCRPESISTMQSAQTMVPVNRLQQNPRQSYNSNKSRNKSKSCYYCGAPNWTREHSRVCKAKNYICGNCNKKGYLDSMCKSRPVHVLEVQPTAQSETIQDCMCSLETAQQQNPSIETMPYSTPYFISREELPQANCNSLQNVQVSRLGANEKSEHIRPAWVTQSKNSKMHQIDVEIDTGAGCNVMLLYKVNELFGQE